MSTIDTVRSLVAELGQAPVPEDIETSLFDAGVIDSFGVMDLVEQLEASFSIKIPDKDMVPKRFETLAKIAAYVDQRKAA